MSLLIYKQQHEGDDCTFLFVDSFSGAARLHEKMREVNCSHFKSSFFVDHSSAYIEAGRARCDRLYIDSDVGLRKYMQLILLRLRNPHVNVAVYEEGLGTYRDDLYSGVKLKLFRFLGAGVYFGGSCFVDEVYVVRLDEYVKRFGSGKARKIVGRVMDLVSDPWVEKLFQGVGELKVVPKRSESCTVYLSDWHVREAVLNSISSKARGDLFLKLHPHLRLENMQFNEFRVIPSAIPAELLLSRLASIYANVVVYHHGTSAKFYCDLQNISWELVDVW